MHRLFWGIGLAIWKIFTARRNPVDFRQFVASKNFETLHFNLLFLSLCKIYSIFAKLGRCLQ